MSQYRGARDLSKKKTYSERHLCISEIEEQIKLKKGASPNDSLGKTIFYANSFEGTTEMDNSAGKERTRERARWQERKTERSMKNAEKE